MEYRESFAKRFEVKVDGIKRNVIINRTFYNELIHNHQDDEMYQATLVMAKRAHELLQKSHYIDTEPPHHDHPDTFFLVYEYDVEDEEYRYEFKIKCNRDVDKLYTMRLYKKS